MNCGGKWWRLHRYFHQAYIGMADLREVQVCTRCGEQRTLRISP